VGAPPKERSTSTPPLHWHTGGWSEGSSGRMPSVCLKSRLRFRARLNIAFLELVDRKVRAQPLQLAPASSLCRAHLMVGLRIQLPSVRILLHSRPMACAPLLRSSVAQDLRAPSLSAAPGQEEMATQPSSSVLPSTASLIPFQNPIPDAGQR
jgi:hypothetical protein